MSLTTHRLTVVSLWSDDLRALGVDIAGLEDAQLALVAIDLAFMLHEYYKEALELVVAEHFLPRKTTTVTAPTLPLSDLPF